MPRSPPSTAKLTEDEIKTLVVDDKWLATLAAGVQGELDRVSQALTGRIRQLAERYATPLPQLTDEVETLAARVDEHLKKMGVGMELKPGYKQTEVGVIPEEWERHARRGRSLARHEQGFYAKASISGRRDAGPNH